MSKERFRQLHPQIYYLDAGDPRGVAAFLAERARLEPGERIVATAKAGEGNMNCVVRVTTDRRTFILKQARPWLEKYPQVDGPWDRTLAEVRFYRAVAATPAVADMMPKLLWLDEQCHALALEDLGAAADFFPLYEGRKTLSSDALGRLLDYLSALHRLRIPAGAAGDFANREMRALNHAHIYRLPLEAGNGFPLEAITPGLAAEAGRLQADVDYVRGVRAIGERYLADGTTLLHGDFFPGSFLETGKGLRVIDPEFAFLGEPEFDVGVLAAHLHLADQPAALIEEMWSRYEAPAEFSRALARRVAGAEIMRRIIGIAQLPIAPDLGRKRALLAFSRELVLG